MPDSAYSNEELYQALVRQWARLMKQLGNESTAVDKAAVFHVAQLVRIECIKMKQKLKDENNESR